MFENDFTKPRVNAPSPNINVTPLIDVLLVLLIIFMVISPRREAQFPIRVPEKAADDPGTFDPGPTGTLLLTMSDEFQLELNTKPISPDELAIVLTSVMEQRDAEARTLFIKAPPLVPYEAVVSLVDAAKGAGVLTVGLLADS